jgi:hypothetical protein
MMGKGSRVRVSNTPPIAGQEVSNFLYIDYKLFIIRRQVANLSYLKQKLHSTSQMSWFPLQLSGGIAAVL